MKRGITSNWRRLRASYPFLLAFAASFVAAHAQAVNLITSVPYTISHPGKYRVREDLILTQRARAAISIESSDVILDLNGFVLSNEGGGFGITGISVSPGLKNLVVGHGAITGFEIGVEVDSGQDCLLENLNIDANRGGAGIALASPPGNQGTNGNRIDNCTLTDGDVAIVLQFENSDVISDCSIFSPTAVGVSSVQSALGKNVISYCAFTNTNAAFTPLGMRLGPTDTYRKILFAGYWQNPPIIGGIAK